MAVYQLEPQQNASLRRFIRWPPSHLRREIRGLRIDVNILAVLDQPAMITWFHRLIKLKLTCPYGEMQVHVGIRFIDDAKLQGRPSSAPLHIPTDAMDDKWAFLYPWREALAQCKAFHDTIDVEHSREFKASQLPVHASLRCWPSLPKGYELLAGRCSIPVPFPAAMALRSDVKRLQRVREAMELFNALAAVSRPAFLQLLAEFVVVADNFADLFTPDFIFVFPVWDCYLVGALSSEDEVATENSVTWGQLFGCSEDPMQYSLAFRSAMDKLEVMRRELKGVLCNFTGNEATVEWGDPGAAIEWTAERVAIPTKGVQVDSTDRGCVLAGTWCAV